MVGPYDIICGMDDYCHDTFVSLWEVDDYAAEHGEVSSRFFRSFGYDHQCVSSDDYYFWFF